jgi:hypothetical protein
MDRKTADELREDLEDFDIAMLVTKEGKFLRSRPMKPNINADGTIRFLTSKKTHKVDEVDSSPQANSPIMTVSISPFPARSASRMRRPTSTNCGRQWQHHGSRTARRKP